MSTPPPPLSALRLKFNRSLPSLDDDEEDVDSFPNEPPYHIPPLLSANSHAHSEERANNSVGNDANSGERPGVLIQTGNEPNRRLLSNTRNPSAESAGGAIVPPFMNSTLLESLTVQHLRDIINNCMKCHVEGIVSAMKSELGNVFAKIETNNQHLLTQMAGMAVIGRNAENELCIDIEKLPFIKSFEASHSSIMHKHLGFLSVYICGSFCSANCDAQEWMKPEVLSQLQMSNPTLSEVSPLSIMFFSAHSFVRGSDWQGPVARIISGMMRLLICQRVESTRSHISKIQLGSVTNPNNLPWLASFGENESLQSTVWSVIDRLEKTNTTRDPTESEAPLKRGKKRPNPSLSDLPVGPIRESEFLIQCRLAVIDKARKDFISTIGARKHSVREYLYQEIWFFLDFMSRMSSSIPNEHEDDYFMKFDPIPPTAQGKKPTDPGGYLHVDLMDVRSLTSHGTLCDAMQIRHPWLTVRLHYRKKLRIHTVPSAFRSQLLDENFCSVKAVRRVHLYRVAYQMLAMSLIQKGDSIFLRSSDLSLRAVHAVALGLRSVLCKEASVPLNYWEQKSTAFITCYKTDLKKKLNGLMWGTRSSATDSRKKAGLVARNEFIKKQMYCDWSEYSLHTQLNSDNKLVEREGSCVDDTDGTCTTSTFGSSRLVPTAPSSLDLLNTGQ